MKKRLYIFLLTALMLLSACNNKNLGSDLKRSENTSVRPTTAATVAATIEKTTAAAVKQSETEAIINKTNDSLKETEAMKIFSNYKDAYKNIISENLPENSDYEYKYDLIYINSDDIPELVIQKIAYLSIYTYNDGNMYTLLQGPLGAMGINGYLYCPKMNSLKYSDADMAGAIKYTTYTKINDNFELEATNIYTEYLFNDANGNLMPEEDEVILDEPIFYIDDKEVTEEEAKAFDVGEYEYIYGKMTIDEIYAKLEN